DAAATSLAQPEGVGTHAEQRHGGRRILADTGGPLRLSLRRTDHGQDMTLLGALSPMGVRPTADGVTVAVHAPDADAVELCLFEDADRETQRLPLPDKVGAVWSGSS